MGERKGQNKYYPPDFDYKKHKTLNSYHGVHALRERGTKAHLGILTIRFEMPFNVWCLGCGNHIGMGVRYNAEKKKVGMYYTTPLYEFQMKCALCPQKFIIRTDPKNFDYELVEGCRRQEKRFDSGELDNVAPVDRGESLRLDADAMYKREHVKKDRDKIDDARETIEKLEWIQERMRDDYGANCALRNQFRTEKKHLAGVKVSEDAMKDRLSLSIQLQPESEDDKIMAKQLLLYKNLGKHKSEPSTSSEGISAKKVIERKVAKRGAHVFESGKTWNPTHSKNAKVVSALIRPKGSGNQEEAIKAPETSSLSTQEATCSTCKSTESNQASKVEATSKVKTEDVESAPSTKKCLLVGYASDSD